MSDGERVEVSLELGWVNRENGGLLVGGWWIFLIYCGLWLVFLDYCGLWLVCLDYFGLWLTFWIIVVYNWKYIGVKYREGWKVGWRVYILFKEGGIF